MLETQLAVVEEVMEEVEFSEEPIALVRGQALLSLPKDLFIPPDAMRVFLEAFEGPLDLLLYLIKKQNVDILDIPIAQVTQQYVKYVELMKELSLELAADYLVMAALLAEIKSRMLLPRQVDEEASEDDPRAELVRRLQEYERFKLAAESMDKLPRLERDTFSVETDSSAIAVDKPLPVVHLKDLVHALMDVLQRAQLTASHHVHIDALTVREKMSHILSTLQEKQHFAFSDLFNLQEGRMGIVVTFLAMLELLKQSLIDFVQAAPFAPIYLQPRTAEQNVSV